MRPKAEYVIGVIAISILLEDMYINPAISPIIDIAAFGMMIMMIFLIAKLMRKREVS